MIPRAAPCSSVSFLVDLVMNYPIILLNSANRTINNLPNSKFMNTHFGTVARLVFVLTFGIAQMVLADEAVTEHNKNIVRDFYTTVLIGRNVDAAPRFLRTDYIQHNPQVPTGLNGFMDTFRERFAQKLPPDYKRELLNVIGDNEMVVVYERQTWTGKDGQHHQALGFDMFRVQDGMIAEHWDAD
jgi:predicted SnoaL-like aldol condensation-catalyzing enzyme